MEDRRASLCTFCILFQASGDCVTLMRDSRGFHARMNNCRRRVHELMYMNFRVYLERRGHTKYRMRAVHGERALGQGIEIHVFMCTYVHRSYTYRIKNKSNNNNNEKKKHAKKGSAILANLNMRRLIALTGSMIYDNTRCNGGSFRGTDIVLYT